MNVDGPLAPNTLAEPEDEAAFLTSYVEMARERHALTSDNEIEIDAHPAVSVADDGVWVAAWVWVPRPDLRPDS